MSSDHHVRRDTPHQPDDCSLIGKIQIYIGKPGDVLRFSPGDRVRRDTRRLPDDCMSCDGKMFQEKPGDGSRMSPGHHARRDTRHPPDDCSAMGKKNLGKPEDVFRLSP